ncbi:MAG: phage holin family protein [Armatimonadetes bacterium]|nr:phage holin family protein [Armatimonadota bacterium]
MADEERATQGEPSGDLLRRLLADAAALGGVYGRATREHLLALARDFAFAALMVGAAVALGVMAIGLAVAAIVMVAAIWLPGWLAALVVLGIMITAMGILLSLGKVRLQRRRAAWAVRMAEEIRWLQTLFTRRS